MRPFSALALALALASAFLSLPALAGAGPSKPISIYISWAAHDELSDNVPLDENLAMRELDAVSKLKAQGAQFDYFLLDMGWFDADGGYREFKKGRWPHGAEGFLAACRERGVKPGFWFSTNVCGWTTANAWMKPLPEWEESRGGYLNLQASLYQGGFLRYQMETMQQWYDRGVRLFKFDFANLGAAPASEIARLGEAEVVRLNTEAWRNALVAFRKRNPEVVLIAYNGYGGDTGDSGVKFKSNIDLRWLDAFDSLYCGDPKPSDVPSANFWRSLDVYSDAMVFRYVKSGVPISRVDSSGFMIGNTGTCYRRGKAAWKGMLILSGARGGLVNTYYGDLALLDESDRAWFAKAQNLYLPLQAAGSVSLFGEYPGAGKPYGFVGKGVQGSVFTLLNPGAVAADVELPADAASSGRVLFSDAGGTPVFNGQKLHLGPGQLAVVGTGGYADPKWDLGRGNDMLVPRRSEELVMTNVVHGARSVSASVLPPSSGVLRIMCSQTKSDGHPWRITGGAPPSGTPMGKILKLKAEQGGRDIPLERDTDRQVWSGLSWAVGEVDAQNLVPGVPVKITYAIEDPKPDSGVADVSAYAVTY
jgi:hypothetical protein